MKRKQTSSDERLYTETGLFVWRKLTLEGIIAANRARAQPTKGKTYTHTFKVVVRINPIRTCLMLLFHAVPRATPSRPRCVFRFLIREQRSNRDLKIVCVKNASRIRIESTKDGRIHPREGVECFVRCVLRTRATGRARGVGPSGVVRVRLRRALTLERKFDRNSSAHVVWVRKRHVCMDA